MYLLTHYSLQTLRSIHYINNIHVTLKRRYTSQKKSNTSQKKSSSKKYSNTIRLPSTKFPLWIKNEERVKLDEKIEKEADFRSLYNWQRNNVNGPEYVLHDGPPYANGAAHIGHAINKIIKDITVRYHFLNGHRIHFKLGWDCHGLPIELKALSVAEKGSSDITPIEIREKARVFATSSIKEQKETFKTWGLLADFENEVYYTYDKQYVQNQLRQFYNLYEKGFVYRDLKPVYWSPSSKTALAEAELEYNEEHVSKSVIVRFKIDPSSFPDSFSVPENCNLYGLIWTTTPWTLPANQAIAYSEELDYSLIKIEGTSDIYLLASKLVGDFENLIEKSVSTYKVVPGITLAVLKYLHHFKKGNVFPFVAGTHIRSTKGTGLVHVAPAHGPEDFVLGLKYNLPMKCMVDEAGCYTKDVHVDLQGLNVLNNGTALVIDKLKTELLYSHNFKHRYPYDWRSKQPVILRSSEQWFVNTNLLKDRAVKCLENIRIEPRHYARRLHELLDTRPFWCISRQRVWGVPIPVMYDTQSKEVIITRDLIEHYCGLIDSHGTDFWWNLSTQELLPKNSEFWNHDHISKGKDILDIWFDSGISWSSVLQGDQVADMYVEGLDQCTGWFQSSLLTSVGLRKIAPYKNIYIHGFAVDENKHKMSKSLENVVEPRDIIRGRNKKPAYGIDVLRWWVACHAVQHEQIPVTENTLKDSKENIQKLRLLIKYLLGTLNSRLPEITSVINTNSILNKYMLHQLLEFHHKVHHLYKKMEYHKVGYLTLDFVANQISAIYVHLTKDRLYCEADNSEHRVVCQDICFLILEILLRAIAPIVPHLVEEVFTYHPAYPNVTYFKHTALYPPAEWKNSDAVNLVRKVLEIKEVILNSNPKLSLPQVSVHIYGTATVIETLKKFSSIELLEILQVSAVSFSEVSGEQNFRIETQMTKKNACERCRKYVCENEELCQRCDLILNTA